MSGVEIDRQLLARLRSQATSLRIGALDDLRGCLLVWAFRVSDPVRACWFWFWFWFCKKEAAPSIFLLYAPRLSQRNMLLLSPSIATVPSTWLLYSRPTAGSSTKTPSNSLLLLFSLTHQHSSILFSTINLYSRHSACLHTSIRRLSLAPLGSSVLPLYSLPISHVFPPLTIPSILSIRSLPLQPYVRGH